MNDSTPKAPRLVTVKVPREVVWGDRPGQGLARQFFHASGQAQQGEVLGCADHRNDQAAVGVTSKSNVHIAVAIQKAVDESGVELRHLQQCPHGQERHEVVDVDIRREPEAFIRLRTSSSPVALAEACRVYCAVEASDSLTRRAIVSRTADIPTPGARERANRGAVVGRSTAGIDWGPWLGLFGQR